MADRSTLRAHIRSVFADELSMIADRDLAERVVDAWQLAMERAGASDLSLDIPCGAILKPVDRPGLGLEHVQGVTRVAAALAAALADAHRVRIDRDTVVAGALLHDVGKLLEGPDRSPGTTLVAHAFTGVAIATQAGLPDLVLHVIAYHSFEGERHRRGYECEVVHRADFLCLDMVIRRELGKTVRDFIANVYLPSHGR